MARRALTSRWRLTDRLADTVQSDRKLAPIRAEPLLRSFGFRTKALDGQPKLRGVVRNRQMNRLVCDEVAKHEVRALCPALMPALDNPFVSQCEDYLKQVQLRQRMAA